MTSDILLYFVSLMTFVILTAFAKHIINVFRDGFDFDQSGGNNTMSIDWNLTEFFAKVSNSFGLFMLLTFGFVFVAKLTKLVIGLTQPIKAESKDKAQKHEGESPFKKSDFFFSSPDDGQIEMMVFQDDKRDEIPRKKG